MNSAHGYADRKDTSTVQPLSSYSIAQYNDQLLTTTTTTTNKTVTSNICFNNHNNNGLLDLNNNSYMNFSHISSGGQMTPLGLPTVHSGHQIVSPIPNHFKSDSEPFYFPSPNNTYNHHHHHHHHQSPNYKFYPRPDDVDTNKNMMSSSKYYSNQMVVHQTKFKSNLNSDSFLSLSTTTSNSFAKTVDVRAKLSMQHDPTTNPASCGQNAHVFKLTDSLEPSNVWTRVMSSHSNRGPVAFGSLNMKYRRPCDICGDIAAGFHCNAYVCEACKKFFIRSSKADNFNKYSCTKSNTCEINKDTRTHCQRCRYQKCIRLGMVLPGAAVFPATDISEIPCRVCGAKSSGFHFGAITCEGCKGFFRRTINERESQRYTCRNGGNCTVTGSTRNNCKSCRYRRCLAVGMSKEGSRIGRQPNAVKHRCAIEIEQIRSAILFENLHVTKAITSIPMSKLSNIPSHLPSTHLQTMYSHSQPYTYSHYCQQANTPYFHESNHSFCPIPNPSFAISKSPLSTGSNNLLEKISSFHIQTSNYGSESYSNFNYNADDEREQNFKLETLVHQVHHPNVTLMQSGSINDPNQANNSQSIYSNHAHIDNPNGNFLLDFTNEQHGHSVNDISNTSNSHISYPTSQLSLDELPCNEQQCYVLNNFSTNSVFDHATYNKEFAHFDTLKSELTKIGDSSCLSIKVCDMPQDNHHHFHHHDQQQLINKDSHDREQSSFKSDMHSHEQTGLGFYLDLHPGLVQNQSDLILPIISSSSQQFKSKPNINNLIHNYYETLSTMNSPNEVVKLKIPLIYPSSQSPNTQICSSFVDNQNSNTTSQSLSSIEKFTKVSSIKFDEENRFFWNSNLNHIDFLNRPIHDELNVITTHQDHINSNLTSLLTTPNSIFLTNDFIPTLNVTSTMESFFNRSADVRQVVTGSDSDDHHSLNYDAFLVVKSDGIFDNNDEFARQHTTSHNAHSLPNFSMCNKQEKCFLTTSNHDYHLIETSAANLKISVDSKTVPHYYEYDKSHVDINSNRLIKELAIKKSNVNLKKSNSELMMVMMANCNDCEKFDLTKSAKFKSNKNTSKQTSKLYAIQLRNNGKKHVLSKKALSSALKLDKFYQTHISTTKYVDNLCTLSSKSTDESRIQATQNLPNQSLSPPLLPTSPAGKKDNSLNHLNNNSNNNNNNINNNNSISYLYDFIEHNKLNAIQQEFLTYPTLLSSVSKSHLFYPNMNIVNKLNNCSSSDLSIFASSSGQENATKCDAKQSNSDKMLADFDGYLSNENAKSECLMHFDKLWKDDASLVTLKTPLNFVEQVKNAAKHLQQCLHRITEPLSIDENLTSEQLWSHMMKHFEYHAQKVICFAQNIPGFKKLSKSDMKHLIQSSMYSIVLTQLSQDYNNLTNDFNYFNFNKMETKLILNEFPQFNAIIDQLHQIGKQLKPMNLDETELALLCCVELLQEDDGHLQDPAKIELIYEQAMNELKTYITDRTASDQRFYDIITIMPTLTKMTQEHQCIVMNLKSERSNYLRFPELYSQMFQLDDDDDNINDNNNSNTTLKHQNSVSSTNFESDQVSMLNDDNAAVVAATAVCVALAAAAADFCRIRHN